MNSSATLLALAGFAFVTSITPGPNNLMLLASGTHFGWRRSLPHLLGISFGFGIMLALVGLGLGEAFARFPALHEVLKWASLAYLLYLAARVATATPPGADGRAGDGGRPMGFVAAALFQVVNPKAWAMALTAVTAYSELGVAALTAVFVAVNLPCCGSWALLGEQMRRWLHRPRALQAFNWGAAALMVVSVLPLLKG
ncbi:LysE family translocator [Roseateles saccharophilus]|uniref:Threonine/homoserine/homoserine lactone efflux protein n=1 Tax=Roseateles saccharophilus TaxID=304 RepID=A0A4R3VE16_ROSSA|nr:LysE family translocator [Roseateles saccharophilus]MDG0834990.1 LysE family translocator [Roseateles saccharophilus]TCV02163.1 threonine/homoserine/homoserine lactone efflux protein [Roseateles saccharophilus]